MKKISSVVAVILATLLSACTPGDPGGPGSTTTTGGTPRATVGSVFGNAAPGTIVGVVCIEDAQDLVRNKKCPAPVSVLVGPDGKYSVKVLEAVGHYDVYASLGGHRSEKIGPRCGFSLNPDNQSGGLFDCPVDDINLTPIVFTPPSAVGLSFSDAGITAKFNGIPDSHSVNGIDVAGARTMSTGAFYEWSKSFLYFDETTKKAETGFTKGQMSYSLPHDAIVVAMWKEDWLGNVMNKDIAELRCGVTSDIQIGGVWYYKCNRFGVTFDKTRGVISFETTPTYWVAPALPNFPSVDVNGRMSFRSIVSGSLTFQPF